MGVLCCKKQRQKVGSEAGISCLLILFSKTNLLLTKNQNNIMLMVNYIGHVCEQQ